MIPGLELIDVGVSILELESIVTVLHGARCFPFLSCFWKGEGYD